MSARERYQRFLRDRHRPNFSRRTAASHAAFLLPHLQPGMRILDLGCGPGSISVGLGDDVIGVDLEPGPASIPLAQGDATRLPFRDASFDAVFSCAVMQHLPDPLTALKEARRVCRPGAVIGLADADWGGALVHPPDPLIERGREIQAQLRGDASPYVGRRLRELLHQAGFARAQSTARGGGGGTQGTAFEAGFQAAAFEAPEAVAVVVEEGIGSAEEMADIAGAWRRFAEEPGAVSTGWWFEALAWAD